MATAAPAAGTSTECYPSWHFKFAPLAQGAQITVFSGCPLNSQGNIACSPESMRANAETQLRRLAPGLFQGNLSLEAYTLARYMQSEVGSGPIEERVAVGEAAVNRAKLERLPRGVLSLLLFRQRSSSPNFGFYGPIHDTAAGCAARGLPEFCHPFGRWASTRQDPTVLTLLLANLIVTGQSENFARGADDQSDLFNRKAFPNPVGTLQAAAARGNYWVGPLPGVDHRHTFLMRKFGFSPTSPQGAELLARGIAAVSSSAGPNWPANLPICTGPSVDAPAADSGAKTFLVAFGAVAGLAAASWLALRVAKNLATGSAVLGSGTKIDRWRESDENERWREIDEEYTSTVQSLIDDGYSREDARASAAENIYETYGEEVLLWEPRAMRRARAARRR